MAKLPKGALKLARTLRDEVKAITAGRPMWYVAVHELELRHADVPQETIDAAIDLAIAKEWLHGTPGRPVISVSYKHKGSFGS